MIELENPGGQRSGAGAAPARARSGRRDEVAYRAPLAARSGGRRAAARERRPPGRVPRRSRVHPPGSLALRFIRPRGVLTPGLSQHLMDCRGKNDKNDKTKKVQKFLKSTRKVRDKSGIADRRTLRLQIVELDLEYPADFVPG